MSLAKKQTSFFEIEDLSIKDFNFFSELSFKLTGIHLISSEKNFSLIQNRMLKLIRRYNLNDYTDLVAFLSTSMNDIQIKNDFISAVTTNKTDFFREEVHFNILLSEIKSALAARSEAWIWSSACSIGAEPYTMAMYLKENLTTLEFSQIKILATDIDLTCLQSATEGFFNEQQMFGLNSYYKNKYFAEIGGVFQIDSAIKEKIHFSQLNLFNYPYSISRQFDVIFCRNVLIYFTSADREKICLNLSKYLKPTGCLILGLSETGSVQIPELKLVSNASYRKVIQ